MTTRRWARPGQIRLGAPASAALCLGGAMLLYHILAGANMAADALHACLAAAWALACLALWRKGVQGGPQAQGETPGVAHDMPSSDASGRRGANKQAHTRSGTVAIAALCLCGALASVAAPLALQGAESAQGCATGVAPGTLGLLAVLVASCTGTAIWEEVAFRRLGMQAVTEALEAGRARLLKAACVCSAVFATLHLAGSAEAVPTVVRGVQVFLFGMAMAGLVGRTGRLAPSMATHALYDVICFMPAILGTVQDAWGISAQALAALETSMSGMAASLVFLAPAAALGARSLLGPRASKQHPPHAQG